MRFAFLISLIKKESPNEGTETFLYVRTFKDGMEIKKESPNEGTETSYREYCVTTIAQ